MLTFSILFEDMKNKFFVCFVKQHFQSAFKNFETIRQVISDCVKKRCDIIGVIFVQCVIILLTFHKRVFIRVLMNNVVITL